VGPNFLGYRRSFGSLVERVQHAAPNESPMDGGLPDRVFLLNAEIQPSSSMRCNAGKSEHIAARRFDAAIVACKKVANEHPTFANAHSCLASAYWGKHMYPQFVHEQCNIACDVISLAM
jgi:hypothetical protein